MLMRIRGVNKVRANGRIYYYHRKTGTRLLAQFGSAAFLQEIERLDGLAAAQPALRAGSLGALIGAYRASPEFAARAPRTRSDYQRIFDWLEPLDAMPLLQIDGPFMFAVRDRAYAQRRRRFANYVLAVLGLLFAWGRPRGWVAANPAAGVPQIERPRDLAPANRPWQPHELDAVLAAAPAGIRAAVALGAWAGLREGDALRFPWSGYDGEAVEFRQGKTGDAVRMRAHRELRAVLDATPRQSPIVVVGERGRPYTATGFRAVFFRLLRGLAEAGRVGPGLTFHGLRHTIAGRLADEGVGDRGIMAVTGHRSASSVQAYTRVADQERRASAAIRTLERIGSRSTKPADRIAKPRRRPKAK